MNNNLYHSIYLLCFVLLCLPGVSQAQQIPAFHQYLFYPQVNNPAGLGQGFIALNYRKQWSDLGEVAPTSYYATADLSRLISPGGGRVGLGLSFMSDKAHIIKRNDISGMFAYKLINNTDMVLSLGIVAGMLSQNLDFGDRAVLSNPFDAALFDGVQKQSVFNGGAGLHYRLSPAKAHQISLDVVAPQLFASDLNYEDGPVMDLQPHLLGRLSYRYDGGAFGFEPVFSYRELLGDKKLKAGNIDLALRAIFLDNQFWAGGGLRLDAETIYFGFGAKPDVLGGLEIIGAFEINSVFGNGWEFGLMYHFGQKSAEQKEMEQYAASLKTGLNDLKKTEAQAREQLAIGNQRLANLETANLDEIALKERIENAKNSLNRSKTIQADLATQIAALNQTAQKAEALKQQDPGLVNSDAYRAIGTTQTEISFLQNNLKDESRKLENRIAEVEDRLIPKLDEWVRAGDADKLQQYFQKKLDRLSAKPYGAKPVAVTRDGASTLITYWYPNAEGYYNINSDNQALVRSMADHIAEQIKDLKAKGITVESILIQALLKDEERFWKNQVGDYAGEFGNRFSLDYRRMNKDKDKSPASRKLQINKGKISLEQLGGLKAHSLKTYLAGQNIKPDATIEVNGPNKQDFPDAYAVIIRVKPR